MEWELERRSTLIQAIGRLPNGCDLDAQEVEGKALLLFTTSLNGRDQELPRNRPASLRASTEELRKLNSICEKLVEHINSMHQPSVSAFYSEAGNLFGFAEQAHQVSESAVYALGCVEVDGSARGAGKKVEAAYVTELAASIFEDVTGKRPTFTSDTMTGQVSGVWRDFLGEFFRALNIKASVASQGRS